ncbi:transmembrane amino acid transporter protein-domain-containing protein [Radiomyces spectabilis]|uniref:transmembrane amino acid transporter protein-domain-containing protein n=1 Tax=Radiomyces spectabilis TaxID=64574 RepID=UPI0022212A5A|nr:transmembrane amino acid transporter protein-domain-containing protein [Radiomyces spectabilis]KAI8393933.1 transmembrane amino acid transporter protein-domain-containing protein [Radiomyces spectabilis]
MSNSQYMRVPMNTHPNYGSVHGHHDEEDPNSYYYSALSDGSAPGSPDSRPRSIRDAVESFAGSYSRASALYVAENLTLPPNAVLSNPPTIHDADQFDDEEQSKTNLVDPHALDRLPSQQSTGYHLFPSLSRHTTVASVLSQQFPPSQLPQRSTFVQSVFNSVNVLVGIGILALPLGFRCAGWLAGSAIFLFCSFGTNYTAKLLARCLDAYPGAVTYGDMGAAAFGDRGRTFVSSIFIVELMTIGVAMVVLLGDGIQSLFRSMSMLTIRLISFSVLTPMLFLPIRKLAYTSLIGIISCACLVVIVIVDGLSKKTQPGSLWDPMETEIIPSDPYNIPLTFGLIMAGFSGHAVFPAIYRDMDEPKKYEKMVDITYVLTMGVYIVMAVAGYTMFGLETMQEITQNLANTPGYNKLLNHLAVWLIVLTPIAKYGLMMNPINLTWELWITSRPSIDAWSKFHPWRKNFLSTVGRIMISALVIYIATVFPGFDRVMSLLGALFSFGISAIFPLACYRRLYGHNFTRVESAINWFLLFVASGMAILGTVWSFLPNDL